MDVRWLEESSILSITLDQQQRYFEMVVSLHNEAKHKLMAWNANGSQLTIKLGALHLRPASGFWELEAISIVENVLFLEGDFGDIAITATAISVEKVI